MTWAGSRCARFGKFSLLGILGAALQVALFDVLIRFSHLPATAAAPIAVELVVLNNFFCHERFTWGDRGLGGIRQRAVRLCRFQVTNGLLSVLGNMLLIHYLVQELKAPPLPSAVAAIAVCAPVNFLLADRWVYRQAAAPAIRWWPILRRPRR